MSASGSSGKPLARLASGSAGAVAATWREAMVAFALAVGAALAVKAPELFGMRWGRDEAFYARNLGLFVLPFLALYFAWKRGMGASRVAVLGAAFAAAAVAANLHAPRPDGWLDVLTAIHLPIALWLVVGIAHAGGRWSDVRARMDFVRFSGELFIYYVLIALGGGVLTGLMAAMLASIGIDFEPFFERWMLPCCASGAVVIAAWLVETKQGAVESLAPMLARLFTPLFTVLLLAFLATMTVTGRALEFHRDLLIAFDALLVVVLGLLVYAITARDPEAPPGAFDVLQVVLLASALLVDAMALWSISSRISELGFTPNRVAVLGENLILLVNLAWSAVLYLRFLRGRAAFAELERWQARYLPVYAAWAAIVVVAFPLVFRAG